MYRSCFGWRSYRAPALHGTNLPGAQRPAGGVLIAAAVAQAVAAGHITPSEAAEIGKVIDVYVRAYQTAELNDRLALDQMTDEELMRIIRKGESTPPRLLTIGPG